MLFFCFIEINSNAPAPEVKIGGSGGNRTPDLLARNQAFFPLNYGPNVREMVSHLHDVCRLFTGLGSRIRTCVLHVPDVTVYLADNIPSRFWCPIEESNLCHLLTRELF